MDIKKLQQLLATIAIAKQKAYNMHWNVRGDDFLAMHKLTEELFEGLTKFFDLIAEKIAMNNEIPLSTFNEYIKNSIIKELNGNIFSRNEVIENVMEDMSIIIKLINEIVEIKTIQPLLDEILLFVDKMKWIFKSHK